MKNTIIIIFISLQIITSCNALYAEQEKNINIFLSPTLQINHFLFKDFFLSQIKTAQHLKLTPDTAVTVKKLIIYAQNHPTFRNQLVNTLKHFLTKEIGAEDKKRFNTLNRKLKQLKRLTTEARLYFLTEWTSQLIPGFKRRGYRSGKEFDKQLLENLTDSPIIDLLNYAANAPHLEDRPNITPNTIKYFSALSLAKQAAYTATLIDNDMPVFSESIYSDRFLNLLADVQKKDTQAFLNEAVIISQYYLYKQFPEKRTQYIKDNELLDIFSAIEKMQEKFPELKHNFFQNYIFSRQSLPQQFWNRLKTTQNPIYSLKAFPRHKFSIESLFNFINSDNFSIFKVFDYQNFHSSKNPWLRNYNGLPLTVLHGSGNNYSELKKDGKLRPVSKYTDSRLPRNRRYIFFGTPYNHFSRNPKAMMFGDSRYYGDIVFEFPFSELTPESKGLINLRGNFFSHYTSAARVNEYGSIPDDIVQLDTKLQGLALNKTLNIYYDAATMDKKILKNDIDIMGWTAQLVKHEDAEKIYNELYIESSDIIRQFEESNQDLINAMQEIKNRLQKKLDNYLKKEILPNLKINSHSKLLEEFVEQYSVVTFSDLIFGYSI